MLAAVIAAGDWDSVKAADVESTETTVAKDAGTGLIAVYASSTEPGQKLDCGAKKGPSKKGAAKKGEAKPLKFHTPKIELTNESGGRTWQLVAMSNDGINRSGLNISCKAKGGSGDTASYGYALVPDFHRANVGKGVGSIAIAIAALLAGWCWYGRYTEKKAKVNGTA